MSSCAGGDCVSVTSSITAGSDICNPEFSDRAAGTNLGCFSGDAGGPGL